MTDHTDLIRRLEIVSAMISLGERISWGQDTALMDEAAAALHTTTAERDAAMAEVDRLRGALVDHNDILRSTFAIAEREGVKGMIASTNWDAFYNRVAVVLKRHHHTSNEARADLTPAKEPTDGQEARAVKARRAT